MNEQVKPTEETASRQPRNKALTRAGQPIMPLAPVTIDENWQLAMYFSRSGVIPKGYPGQAGSDQNVAAVLGAVQMGAAVGLPAIVAVQTIMIVNNRYALYGDGQLGVVRNSGQLEAFEEGFEGEAPATGLDYPDDFAAICCVKRRGEDPREERFSVGDAKTAGLWKKSGPWTTNPRRMLKYRARAFALRDTFPDILLGLQHSGEELEDLGTLVEGADGIYQPASTTAERPQRSEARWTLQGRGHLFENCSNPDEFAAAAVECLNEYNEAGELDRGWQLNIVDPDVLGRLHRMGRGDLVSKLNLCREGLQAKSAPERAGPPTPKDPEPVAIDVEASTPIPFLDEAAPAEAEKPAEPEPTAPTADTSEIPYLVGDPLQPWQVKFFDRLLKMPTEADIDALVKANKFALDQMEKRDSIRHEGTLRQIESCRETIREKAKGR